MPKKTKITGLNEIKATLLKYKVSIDNEIDVVLKKAVLVARNKAVKKAPIDRGQLRQGINNKRIGRRHYRLQSQMNYTLPQEFGTGKSMEIPTDIDENLREIALKFKFSEFGINNPRSIKPKLFLTNGYYSARDYLEVELKKVINKKR